MTTENYMELHDKYGSWCGRPVELISQSPTSQRRRYTKFLLKEITGLALKKEGRDGMDSASVIVQDLASGVDKQLSLSEFDEQVRLIQIGNAPTVKLTNHTRSATLHLGESSESVELFIIQLNSHFGKKMEEWTEVVANLYLDVYAVSSNQKLSVKLDRIYLSTLITNQNQPVFNLSHIYPIDNLNTSKNFYDALEIVVGERTPIQEDYEVTIVYSR